MCARTTRVLMLAAISLYANLCLQGCGDDDDGGAPALPNEETVDTGNETQLPGEGTQLPGQGTQLPGQGAQLPGQGTEQALIVPEMKPPIDAATPSALQRQRRLSLSQGHGALEELRSIRDHFFVFPTCSSNICGPSDFKGRLTQMDHRLLTMLNLHNSENRRACLSSQAVPVEWVPPELPGQQIFPMKFSCVSNNSSPFGVSSTLLGMDEDYYYVADFYWPNFQDSSTSINVLAKVSRTLYDGLASDVHIWQIWLEAPPSSQVYSQSNLLEIRASTAPRDCNCSNVTLDNLTGHNCTCDPNLKTRTLDLAYASSNYGQLPNTNLGVSCGVQLVARDGKIRGVGVFANSASCSANSSDVCGDGSTLESLDNSTCSDLEPSTYGMRPAEAAGFAPLGADMLASVRDLDVSGRITDFDEY